MRSFSREITSLCRGLPAGTERWDYSYVFFLLPTNVSVPRTARLHDATGRYAGRNPAQHAC